MIIKKGAYSPFTHSKTFNKESVKNLLFHSYFVDEHKIILNMHNVSTNNQQIIGLKDI
jgi:hypothetical protein